MIAAVARGYIISLPTAVGKYRHISAKCPSVSPIMLTWMNAHQKLPPVNESVLFADENKILFGKLTYAYDEAHWATGDKYWDVKTHPYWMKLPPHPLKG